MVSKKKQDYGFSGYRAPIIPRAPRSIRTRGPRKILEEDSKLCAFELLAAVAGKLLKESESSASSNIAEANVQLSILEDANDRGQPKDDKALKTESYDHGSCAESAFIPENSVQEENLLFHFKGLPEADNDSVLEHNSLHASSEFLKKVDCGMKLGISEEKSTIGSSICLGNNFKTEFPENQSEDDKNKIGDLSKANTYNVKDPAAECENTNVLINSDSSVKLPLYRNPIPGSSPRKHCNNNVKLGIRDDDENLFGCSKFSTKIRSFKPQSRIGHRRIRKMVASKYWKAGPKLKECELYNTSEGMKTFYRYRKNFYARERYQRAAPMKKRKLSDHSFAVEYDQEASSNSIFNLPEKEPRTLKGHQKTKDSHVQFSIKSFRVPELYVEVPETATVSSLKRTVMEAVTAILGGGLRVGVVLQGKKIRDDSRTLQQAGISQSSNLDTLGFTLEPSFTHLSPTKSPKKQKLPLTLPSDVDQQSPRSPATPMIHSGISNASIQYPPTTKFGDVNNGEIVSSPKTPMDAPMDGEVVSDSKALVAVSPMDTEALEVVPVNSKSKRTELSQRRTRRPFSVGEVEALVEAVETLGTGRWRDVKMRAFETADHRTYVDLKDKWKTLVHTASISPQQRRGEPVPQELLDRVLSAHSYWSLHQSKQHGKIPIDGLKIVDAREEIVG